VADPGSKTRSGNIEATTADVLATVMPEEAKLRRIQPKPPPKPPKEKEVELSPLLKPVRATPIKSSPKAGAGYSPTKIQVAQMPIEYR